MNEHYCPCDKDHDDDDEEEESSRSSVGVGLGSTIAVVVSWTANHSIFWCIVHGVLSWFYLIYYVIFVR